MRPVRKVFLSALALLLVNTAVPAFAAGSSGNTGADSFHFLTPLNGPVWQPDKKYLSYETPPVTPGAASDMLKTDGGPIIIDNDAESAEPVAGSFQWQDLPDQEGKTQISTGACFPVSLLTELSSKSAHTGDPIQARTIVDIKIGGKLIAPKGTLVTGHVTSVEKARALLHSELSVKRWMRASGALGLQFDEMVTDSGEHIPLVAQPARQPRIVKNGYEGRVLGVNDKGQICAPLSIQLKHQALHLAIRSAASAGGVFSMGAVPVAYGVIGAINPSFAFMHTVGKNVPHRRIKGFAMGLVSGLPGGGMLIADSIIHGQEAIVMPGDQFLAEFKQDFTGEASTNAELIPGGTKKVHGEVIDKKKDSK